MSNQNHPWSRDPVAQAAVRAAEDAAAAARTPVPDHRDLPAAVAELRERVARLTTKHNAMVDLARLDAGWVKTQEDCLAAERDAAIRERDAALARVAELERDRRPATWQEEEAAVEGAWSLCGLEPDWPNDEPGTIVRHAESMRREIVRLRDRVAELEQQIKLDDRWAAAAPAANAGGEANNPAAPDSSPQPVAWGVLVGGKIDRHAGSDALFIDKDEADEWCGAAKLYGRDTVVPLYATPVAESATTPQPPRGWLTQEERELIAVLKDDDHYTEEGHNIAKALLARSTPPRVKVPSIPLEFNLPAWNLCMARWIAAIREAGGEVE